jgi:DNA-binding MarR family transcriptional regulator
MRDDDVVKIHEGVRQLTRRMRSGRLNARLGFSAIGILSALHRLGPMPAARLAEEERLQPQSLTRLIAALEKTKLIGRTRSDEDRREILLSITAAGRKALVDDLKDRRRWLERALGDALSPAERKRLVDAADIMLKLANWIDTGEE